jgi:serine 3-dehydrogenase
MISVKDKIVFITGASAGIGEAAARLFAENGSRLILAARRLDRLQKLADEFTKQFGAKIYCFQLDVRNQKEVESKINALPPEWKNIDILVNNAGLSRGLDKLYEGKLLDWEEMIDTNIKGLLYVSRVVIPGMVERGRGDIVNIGSIAGYEVYPGGNVYCATKSAVNAITKGMQIDLVATPIRVCSVDPGMAETEFSMVRYRGDNERAAKTYQGIQALTGADVAEAILFCVTRPPHVNIHQIRVMPTHQAAATITHRQ